MVRGGMALWNFHKTKCVKRNSGCKRRELLHAGLKDFFLPEYEETLASPQP